MRQVELGVALFRRDAGPEGLAGEDRGGGVEGGADAGPGEREKITGVTPLSLYTLTQPHLYIRNGLCVVDFYAS